VSEPIVFWGGAYIPKSAVAISPDDRGFLFGDGVYDVIRAADGRLFRAEDHVERLRDNAAALALDDSGLDVVAVARELLRRNDLERGDATVYVQLTRGVAPRRHAFPEPPPPPSVFVAAQAFERRHAWLERGIRMITVPDVRWGRCDIKTICLLPNVLAAERAKKAGADEALFVRDGIALEGAHTSFFAVIDGSLVTAPLSNRILPGVTRRVVLGLASGLGIPTAEAPIKAAELPRAAEAFVTGTTTDVSPVIAIDGGPIGSGKPGPVTRALQQALTGALEAASR